MISWWSIIALGAVALPVGIMAIAVLTYSLADELKAYKYHRLRTYYLGSGETYYKFVNVGTNRRTHT